MARSGIPYRSEWILGSAPRPFLVMVPPGRWQWFCVRQPFFDTKTNLESWRRVRQGRIFSSGTLETDRQTREINESGCEKPETTKKAIIELVRCVPYLSRCSLPQALCSTGPLTRRTRPFVCPVGSIATGPEAAIRTRAFRVCRYFEFRFCWFVINSSSILGCNKWVRGLPLFIFFYLCVNSKTALACNTSVLARGTRSQSLFRWSDGWYS